LTTRGGGDNDDDDDDDRPKEFATTSSAAPRRLNDIATAPPELKRLPRGAAKHPAGGNAKTTKRGAGAGAGVLSMAQRAMMEVERENAIRRYREMKERKAKEADRTFSQGEGPAVEEDESPFLTWDNYSIRRPILQTRGVLQGEHKSITPGTAVSVSTTSDSR
jgi:hypothetical protein